MARAIKLLFAPNGIFEYNGHLVLKTAHCTEHGDGTIMPECYVLENGHYFWGDAKTPEERNNLMVTPVETPTFTPPNEWVSVEERFPDTEGCYLVTYVFIKDGRASEKSFISTMDYYEQYEGEDNKHFSHEGYQGLRVTHWMPLPAPPDRRPPEGRKDT